MRQVQRLSCFLHSLFLAVHGADPKKAFRLAFALIEAALGRPSHLERAIYALLKIKLEDSQYARRYEQITSMTEQSLGCHNLSQHTRHGSGGVFHCIKKKYKTLISSILMFLSLARRRIPLTYLLSPLSISLTRGAPHYLKTSQHPAGRDN